jgi:hypothetical protein
MFGGGGAGEPEGLSMSADPRFAAVFQQQQYQEDQFLKSNIDYENRLKEHIYQFEDKLGASSNVSAAGRGTTVHGNNSTHNAFGANDIAD